MERSANGRDQGEAGARPPDGPWIHAWFDAAAAPPAPATAFEKRAFLVYLVGVTAAFLFLLRDFLITLFLAAVFTALTYPVYFWMLMRTGRKYLSALVTLLLFSLMVALPLAVLGALAFQQFSNLILDLDQASIRARMDAFAFLLRRRFPESLRHVDPHSLSGTAFGWAQGAYQYLLRNGPALSIGLANQVLDFFVMLMVMFYFYLDGHRILQRLLRWSPLKRDYERILIGRFVSVSKGTLKGVLVVGAVQGALGTLTFVAVGMRSPVFLGALMAFCSLVPAVGSSLVWFPVGLFLLAQERWVAGLAVWVVGGLVISSIDNILRPVLVGKDVKMHDLLVLLSTLGGISIFGLVGVVVGPVLASLFLSIWHMFEEIFSQELSRTQGWAQPAAGDAPAARNLQATPPAAPGDARPSNA